MLILLSDKSAVFLQLPFDRISEAISMVHTGHTDDDFP